MMMYAIVGERQERRLWGAAKGEWKGGERQAYISIDEENQEQDVREERRVGERKVGYTPWKTRQDEDAPPC
jgi:hypothetical protein